MANAPRTSRPLQNRVAPTGEIEAVPARGLLMGNRGGQFHRPDRTLGRRRWASRAWIACVLEWKGRHEDIWVDRHYTQLFFLDEATALAAGHRPCGYCRRADYRRFAGLWADTEGLAAPPKASEMDERLHVERWASRSDATPAPVVGSQIPGGTIVMHDDWPSLVRAGRLWRWGFGGYERGPPLDRSALYPIVTPPKIVAILGAGYRPLLHPSAH